MRIIKLGVISIIVFFVLFSIIGALFPSDILVVRSIAINRPEDSVRPYINDFVKWNDWMEGAKTGDLKVFEKDSTHAVFGNIIMTLTSKTDTSWMYQWQQGGSQQTTLITLAHQPMGCSVQWQYQQHLPWYPWVKLASVMNDKIIGTSIEQNLDNLRKAVEH